MKNTISWRERRGVALIIVLGLALFASVVFATIFTLLRQSAAVSQNFGQRITASAWNDRILTRIAAVIAAQPWEERFYIKNPTENPDGLYTFKAGKFPFEDLEYECRVEGIRFDGAIMDVPNERKYRVKLVVTCENPNATYATFSEVHYNPGLLNLANRGVRQIVMNLSPEDLDLSLNAFAASINRLSGIARDVGKTTPVPAVKTGASQQITPELAAATVEPPTENNISTIPQKYAELVDELQKYMEIPDRDYFASYCRARDAILAQANRNNSKMAHILLPNGQTMAEFASSDDFFWQGKGNYLESFEKGVVVTASNLLRGCLRYFPRFEPGKNRRDFVMQKALFDLMAPVRNKYSFYKGDPCTMRDSEVLQISLDLITSGSPEFLDYFAPDNPNFTLVGERVLAPTDIQFYELMFKR